MSLKDKTARQSLTNYPSAELKNYLKQHPTTATSPTCTSALEPMSIGADGCSQDAVTKEDETDEVTQFCPHGYDVACLICGFGTKGGKRVYHTRPTSKKEHSKQTRGNQ